MNKYLVSVAAALMLSACATHGFDGHAGGMCNEANTHCVQVTVSGGTIAVDREKLRVRGPSHVIFWRINNAGGQNYSFPANGIDFDTDSGKKQFSCVRQQPTVFRCLDPNSERGEFKYTVRLEGSPAVKPLDPWVIND
jgi:hypothetical protein